MYPDIQFHLEAGLKAGSKYIAMSNYNMTEEVRHIVGFGIGFGADSEIIGLTALFNRSAIEFRLRQ